MPTCMHVGMMMECSMPFPASTATVYPRRQSRRSSQLAATQIFRCISR